MNTRFIKLFLCLSMLAATVSAKTYQLTFADKTRSFSLRIYCTAEGKGAFVQYDRQKEFMPLRLRKFTTSVLTNTHKQPEGYHYEWNELLKGRVTGTYGITEQSGNVTKAWYRRHKDGRQFNFNAVYDASLDKVQKYLLHGVLISFAWTSADSQFMFSYPDGTVSAPTFLSLDAPDMTRSAYLKTTILTGTMTWRSQFRMPGWVSTKCSTFGCMTRLPNGLSPYRKARTYVQNVPAFAM